VWDALRPHRRAIFSADRSAGRTPAIVVRHTRSAATRRDAPVAEGAEQSTDDEGEQEDREARRDEERKARKKRTLWGSYPVCQSWRDQ
jgi:hypothetical protein